MIPRQRKIIAALGLLLMTGAVTSLAQETATRPQSFAYILQADAVWKTREKAVSALAACDRDWIVVDAAYSGGADGRWTAADVQAIRAGKTDRRLLAYLSIGEAEDYRDYWQRSWDADRDGKPDAGAADFLMPVNPDWAGNYRVRYWRPEWQKLILAEVDRISAQGFDGIYMDIVDAFETFEFDGKDWIDDRKNDETGRTYRQDMIAWVKTIGERLRRDAPARLLIPQNGSQLITDEPYLNIVSAIGMEDVFTNGNKKQKPAEAKSRIQHVKPLIAARKPVLLIEYPKKQALRDEVMAEAKSNGFVWLLTDRQLKTIGESGH